MRKRDKSIHIRLTQKELDYLHRRSEKAGLPVSTFIRFLIKGMVPHDSPPPEFWQVRNDLFSIGNDIKQLAAIARAQGSIQAQRLDDALADLNKVALELLTRQLPENIGTGPLLKQGRKVEGEE